MRHKLKYLILFFITLSAVFVWFVWKYSSGNSSQKIIEIQQAPAEDDATAKIENQESRVQSREAGNSSEESEEKKDTAKRENSGIIKKLMRSGFQKKKKRDIDTIVIHSSYNALGDDPYSVDGVIKEYEKYGVSAHYLIGRDGKIYQLVQDNNIAWHAGTSIMPDRRSNVNQFSLGIELLYAKKEKPNLDQYSALKKLTDSLKEKYDIKNIVGHNQIAPDRKDDPWNFDWDKF